MFCVCSLHWVVSSGEITIRDHYLLAYAESLHADASLWRLTVEYMYACGDVGRLRADEVLLRVPLRLQTQNHQPKLQSQGAAEGGEGDENEEVKTGDIVGVLKEINETCLEHQREEVRRVVCRVRTPSTLSFLPFTSEESPLRENLLTWSLCTMLDCIAS